MPAIDTIPDGSFCWVELVTTDQAAAKNFYTKVMNWSAEDSPMGPDNYYTMFKLEGRTTGAAYNMSKEMLAAHVPAHWGLYAKVKDVDAAAKRVPAAGGALLKEPFDVFDAGRMAVVRDPGGAVLMLWQAGKHTGFGITGVGSFCWADLYTPDTDVARKFYGEVLGWTFMVDPKDPNGYVHINNGETMIGGMPPKKYHAPGVPPHWQVWFHVSNTDAVVAAATGMGAKVLMPPTTMGGVGRCATLADPQGVAFAIITPLH